MYKTDDTIDTTHVSSEILVDRQENGKERPWKEKKIGNVSYHEILEILEMKKANNVGLCGDILEFKVNADGKMKLATAWFCKSPLCPMCNWRKAMKHSVQISKVVKEVVRRKPKCRFLFLTLTARNAVDGESLNSAMKEMTKGFNRLFKYKKVQKNLIGYMRASEVTVNEKDGTYNQHMHVLIAVESSYFTGSDNYINQADWTELWKKAMKLPYTPVVNVKAVKNKVKNKKTGEEKDGLLGAIKETAKYPVKDSEYLTGDIERDTEIVNDLEKGLYKKRLLAYGGLFKEIHKELNLDKSEDELVHIDDEKDFDETDETVYSLIATWNRQFQNYFVK